MVIGINTEVDLFDGYEEIKQKLPQEIINRLDDPQYCVALVVSRFFNEVVIPEMQYASVDECRDVLNMTCNVLNDDLEKALAKAYDTFYDDVQDLDDEAREHVVNNRPDYWY